MAELWCIQENGREMGPMGTFFLKVLVDERKIGPATLIRLEGGTWFPAGQLEGLFEGARDFGTASPDSSPARTGLRPDPSPALSSTGYPSSPPSQPTGGTGFGRVGGWIVLFVVVALVRAGCRGDRTPHHDPPRVEQPRFDQRWKMEPKFHPPGPVENEQNLPAELRKLLDNIRNSQPEPFRHEMNVKVKKFDPAPIPVPPK